MPTLKATRTITHRGSVTHLTFDETATLLDAVRQGLGVTSASKGCEDGSCGACRVLLDGELVNACRFAWGDVPAEARVETYEELEASPAATRAVQAFHAERPTRCALCVGALGVTAVALDRAGKSGDPDAIEVTLAHATCMCTGRGSWRRALSTKP